MATTLATFISKIGFEVDQSSLKKLDSNLKLLENRLSALSSKFSDISNNKTIAAAARLANAEAKRINAEIGLQNKKLQVSKIEGQTEKLKQQTSLAGIKLQQSGLQLSKAQSQVEKIRQSIGLEGAKLQNKKATTEQIYARANAQTMIQKMKVGASADMAAIKESLDAGMKLRRKQESDQNLGRQILLMQKRNGFEESKLRRLQLSNQSQVHKVQMIAAQRNISSAQRVTELAQRAATKATPYAARSDMSEGSSGGRGRLGLGNGGLFGNVSVGAGLSGVAGGLAAQRFGEKAYRTGNFQIAQAPQFEFITGSAEEADKQVAFLNKEVDRLSLNLMDASAQYRQLLASTYKPLGIEQTQKLFTSVQNLSAMMGLSTDAQNRSFRALSQMASKSQVYSEELRGQLAESLPNAVGIFADALFGGDTKKLFKEMEDGKVGLKEINKVIDYMATLTKEDLLAKMLDSPARKMEKLRTSVTRMFVAINDAGVLDAMVFALDKLADGVVWLTKTVKPLGNMFQNLWSHTKDLYNLVSSFAGLLGGIFFKNSMATLLTLTLLTIRFKAFGAVVLRILPMVGKHAGMLSKIAPIATKAAMALSFLWKKMLVPAAITAGLLLIEDLIFALRGDGSVLGDLAKDGEGWSSNLAKGIIAIGRVIELSLGGLISLLTGDFAYSSEVWDKFKKDMLELWPFDVWWGQFMGFFDRVLMYFSEMGKVALAIGKFAGQPLNPYAAADAYSAVQGFNQFREMQNTRQPAPESRGNQLSGITNSYQTTIEINGTGLDPKQIADEVTRQFTVRLNSAAANRSNLVMRPM